MLIQFRQTDQETMISIAMFNNNNNNGEHFNYLYNNFMLLQLDFMLAVCYGGHGTISYLRLP